MTNNTWAQRIRYWRMKRKTRRDILRAYGITRRQARAMAWRGYASGDEQWPR